MSKDLVVAGVIIASCVAVTVVAFLPPDAQKPPTGETQRLAQNPRQPEPPPPTIPLQPVDTLPPVDVHRPLDPGPIAARQPPFAPTDRRTPGPFETPRQPQLPGPVALPPVVEPTPPALPPKQTEAKGHTVAKDEYLSDISLKHYGSSKHWKKIAAANPGVDPNNLKVGTKLVIPALDEPKAVESAPEPAGLGDGERVYAIKKGDSYYRIAERELGDASRHKEIEQLNKVPASELHEGQKIKLPAKGTKVARGPSAEGGAAPDAGGKRTHTVAAGEMLSTISQKYYGTSKHWREIVKANPGVDPEDLRVGQKLVIPEVAGAKPVASGDAHSDPAPVASGGGGAAASGQQYKVQTGDTLGKIAKKFYGKEDAWKKIQKANPGLDPDNLQVGKTITLPDVPAGGATPPERGTEPAPVGGRAPGRAPVAPVAPGPEGNPFGAPAGGSPFGTAPAPAPAPAPPGGAAPAPTGPSPFGPGAAPAGSPFGTAPAASPYGSGPAASPYGGSTSSPYGAGSNDGRSLNFDPGAGR